MEFETEEKANTWARELSKMDNIYYSTFKYKDRWYLTSCYN